MRRIGILLAGVAGLALGGVASPFAVSFEGVIPADVDYGVAPVRGREVDVLAVLCSKGGTERAWLNSRAVVATNGYLNVTISFPDGAKFVPGMQLEWYFAKSIEDLYFSKAQRRFASQQLETLPYALAAEHADAAVMTTETTIENARVDLQGGGSVVEMQTDTLALSRSNPTDTSELRIRHGDEDFSLEGADVVLRGPDQTMPLVGAYTSLSTATIGGTSLTDRSDCELTYAASNACILAIDVTGRLGEGAIMPSPDDWQPRWPVCLMGVKIEGHRGGTPPFQDEFKSAAAMGTVSYGWMQPWLTCHTPGCKSAAGVSSRLTVPLMAGETCRVKLAFACIAQQSYIMSWSQCFDSCKMSGSQATLRLGVYPVKVWEVEE